METKKKILIIGHARHGKDSVAESLKNLFGFNFKSSSEAASLIFIYDLLKVKYHYNTTYECFKDRVNHRKEWHDLITMYNTPDPTKLAQKIMSGNDVYVGMRSNIELEACVQKKMFDSIIGVYDPRKPLEDTNSFTIDMWKHAHVVIPNAGTIDDLGLKVRSLESLLFHKNSY